MTLAVFQSVLQVVFSLPPVLFFLTGLVLLDSYKLVKLRSILIAIGVGCGVAVTSFFCNQGLIDMLGIDTTDYSRYVAPFVEETLKAAFLVYLIRSGRLGFMVDAAIYGFAVGAGFAVLENIYYLQTTTSTNIAIWVIRGFGTAIMHGGTTAIFGLLSKSIADRADSVAIRTFVPGLLIAIAVHSFYNHFFFSPLLSTLLILFVLPTIMFLVFKRSEKSIESWLGVGFDTDQELFQMLVSGNLSDTNVGRYLQTIRERFPGEVVFDMVCYLRLHLELSMVGKGLLLMRQAGFDIPPGPDVREKFDELGYLEKSIGPTGKLAILPFLHSTKRDLWQLHMLQTG